MNLVRIAIIRNYLKRINLYPYNFILKISGLKVGKNTLLGRINCNWPNRLFIGNNCEITDGTIFKISHPFNSWNSIVIKNNVFLGENCEFNCASKIEIGDNCLIASNTTFVDIGHDFDKNALIREQAVNSSPITVESDVWIGTGCTILQGVVIGQGAILAAGSVLTKSIPAYEIWAGVPAKYLKKRV